MDNNWPIGAKVIILSEGNMQGVVVGHSRNAFDQLVIHVRDEFRKDDGFCYYYEWELLKE